MVEQIFDGVARGVGAVEDTAHDDGVVGGVVMAEQAAGGVGDPGERGTAEQAVEEASVDGLEDFVEVVVVAVGGADALAAAGLADAFGLFGDGFGLGVATVAVRMLGGDRPAVELGEQDVGDGVMDRFGGVLEEIAEADDEAGFAEADGGVEAGEAAEFDLEGRHGRARAEEAVFLVEDGVQCGGGYWERDGRRHGCGLG